MKDFTAKIYERLNQLPPMYSTDDAITEDARCVYLFLPGSAATWVLWEYDPISGMAFGWAELLPGCGEMGYVYVPEITQVKTPLGLTVEIDLSLSTVRKALEHAPGNTEQTINILWS